MRKGLVKMQILCSDCWVDLNVEVKIRVLNASSISVLIEGVFLYFMGSGSLLP
jgi:hypothetical protein